MRSRNKMRLNFVVIDCNYRYQCKCSDFQCQYANILQLYSQRKNSGIPIVIIAPSTQIMVSKYHSSPKEPGFLAETADSRAGAENVQNEHEKSDCGMSKGRRSQCIGIQVSRYLPEKYLWFYLLPIILLGCVCIILLFEILHLFCKPLLSRLYVWKMSSPTLWLIWPLFYSIF